MLSNCCGVVATLAVGEPTRSGVMARASAAIGALSSMSIARDAALECASSSGSQMMCAPKNSPASLERLVVFGARRLNADGRGIARSCATDGAVMTTLSRRKQSDARESSARVRCAGQISPLLKTACLVSARSKCHAWKTGLSQSSVPKPDISLLHLYETLKTRRNSSKNRTFSNDFTLEK